MENAIEIYKASDNSTQIEIRFENETVWLTMEQMSLLFEKSKATVNEHILNIFKENELEEKQVKRKIGISDFSTKPTNIYNLDVIISVGYRVNSKRGTQFRQWATQRLKDYLVKGYAINNHRLQQAEERFRELQKAVVLIKNVADKKSLSQSESKGILKILEQYSRALEWLDQYDHQQLPAIAKGKKTTVKLGYAEAKKQIDLWRKVQNAGKLFGNEKDQSFKSSLNTIFQTFDGKELYPSLEEKATHLLYFVVKNHSFSDGNKRIAAGVFAYFLQLNKALYKDDGLKRIDDNALVAITLLIAESKPEEKEQIVKLIANLIKA